MITASNERKYTKREALFTLLTAFALFVGCSLGLSAQDGIPKIKDKDDKPAVKADDLALRGSIETSGYTRPGNPDDKLSPDGKIIEAGFSGANVQKFKIMGGTVYFAVFRNTAAVEGDTFGTGMTNIDTRFESGRSFRDSMSPRFDRKAKYLYLYQVVNDRNLAVVPTKGNAAGGGIAYPVVGGKIDTKAKVPVADDIASFALKILVDPRDITSWGHFRDAGFVAKVTDTDLAGTPVKGDNKILAISHLPAIETKISHPRFSRRSRAFPLGELEAGFGVDKSNLNLQTSKAYGELKQVLGTIDKDSGIKWINFVDGLLKGGAEPGKEPEYVQLMYGTSEERLATPIIPGAEVEGVDDDVTRAIFRVDWERLNSIKQGERSVVFGFTTDLPPVTAPIRIDTPSSAAEMKGLRLANYFADEETAQGTSSDPTRAGLSNKESAAALALSLVFGLTSDQPGNDAALFVAAQGGGQAPAPVGFGAAPTPVPAPAAPAAGFAGITGGFSSLGGAASGGGGAGVGIPSFAGGYSRPGGGGFGGMPATAQSTPPGQGQFEAQKGSQTINFNATLVNQQQQFQQQGQFQFQNQHQHGGGRGHGGNCCNQGHVVPAPASLLLGLLGLPGLWFLRRRKNTEVTPETTETPATV